MATAPATPRAEIVVDLGAIAHNVRRLREHLGATRLMVVVNADGYGHGMAQVAAAAREAGADWLGVATLEEALALRDAGDRGRLLCWLAVPGEPYDAALAEDVDVSAYTVEQVAAVDAAAARVRRTARLHLKVDTGLSRGGAAPSDWPALVRAALAAPHVEVVGLWSHLACSDDPGNPANDVQEAAFRAAVAVAEELGARPEVRHLANSGGALWRPSAHFDLVRVGIASYGLSPAPEVSTTEELGLRRAMTVRAALVLAKDVPAGAGVSYGHTFVAPEVMRVGLVPVGYGDGVPRHASGTAEVQLRGHRSPVLGRICMDQFVVGAPRGEAGDQVLLFGPGDDGEPTADDWARWCGTINYEIVTRMGGREHRRWVR
ncbi:MAG: alanine racemase [Marmoricola sp.]